MTHATLSSPWLDTAFEALAHPGRRVLLAFLRDEPREEVPVSSLIDCFEGTRSDCFNGRVAVTLYHTHLPKLDDSDIIEWDRDRDVVCYESAGFVEQCLSLVDRQTTDPPQNQSFTDD